MPGGGELPDRAARARDDEVGRAERRAELVGERHEPVVVAPHATAQRLVVALAAQVQHGGPAAPNASTTSSFRLARALAAAEDEQHARSRRQVEDRGGPRPARSRGFAPGSAGR